MVARIVLRPKTPPSRCGYCHAALFEGDTRRCPSCRTALHLVCWTGRCPTLGCDGVFQVRLQTRPAPVPAARPRLPRLREVVLPALMGVGVFLLVALTNLPSLPYVASFQIAVPALPEGRPVRIATLRVRAEQEGIQLSAPTVSSLRAEVWGTSRGGVRARASALLTDLVSLDVARRRNSPEVKALRKKLEERLRGPADRKTRAAHQRLLDQIKATGRHPARDLQVQQKVSVQRPESPWSTWAAALAGLLVAGLTLAGLRYRDR